MKTRYLKPKQRLERYQELTKKHEKIAEHLYVKAQELLRISSLHKKKVLEYKIKASEIVKGL